MNYSETVGRTVVLIRSVKITRFKQAKKNQLGKDREAEVYEVPAGTKAIIGCYLEGCHEFALEFHDGFGSGLVDEKDFRFVD